jgi:hypothetical protein
MILSLAVFFPQALLSISIVIVVDSIFFFSLASKSACFFVSCSLFQYDLTLLELGR